MNPNQILQRRPSARREERVSHDRSGDLAEGAEASPREVAEEDRGRSAAPLGAQQDEEQG